MSVKQGETRHFCDYLRLSDTGFAMKLTFKNKFETMSETFVKGLTKDQYKYIIDGAVTYRCLQPDICLERPVISDAPNQTQTTR